MSRLLVYVFQLAVGFGEGIDVADGVRVGVTVGVLLGFFGTSWYLEKIRKPAVATRRTRTRARMGVKPGGILDFFTEFKVVFALGLVKI